MRSFSLLLHFVINLREIVIHYIFVLSSTKKAEAQQATNTPISMYHTTCFHFTFPDAVIRTILYTTKKHFIRYSHIMVCGNNRDAILFNVQPYNVLL